MSATPSLKQTPAPWIVVPAVALAAITVIGVRNNDALELALAALTMICAAIALCLSQAARSTNNHTGAFESKSYVRDHPALVGATILLSVSAQLLFIAALSITALTLFGVRHP